MWEIIKNTIAAIAIVPIIPFVITYIGYSFMESDRKKSIRLAMDVSTLFFLICVSALFNLLFHSNFGLYLILLMMVIGAGLLGNAQYRKSGVISWKRIVKVIWRLTFFVTVSLYIILVLFALIKTMFTVA